MARNSTFRPGKAVCGTTATSKESIKRVFRGHLDQGATPIVIQTESFVKQARDQGLPVSLVQHDLDTKFTRSFDRQLKSRRVRVKKGAYRSPNTNAYVERFIQTIHQECLDRFVIFGERHMDHLCAEYLAHYHEERPHQSLENVPITAPKKRGRPKTKRGNVDDEIVPLANVRCRQRLGGLLKSYSQMAA